MTTYAFINSDNDDYEVYEVADYDTYDKALNHAALLADEYEADIEVFSFKHTVEPFWVFMNVGISDPLSGQGRKDAIETRNEYLALALALAELSK